MRRIVTRLASRGGGIPRGRSCERFASIGNDVRQLAFRKDITRNVFVVGCVIPKPGDTFVRVETLEAVENAEAIAAVDGVDVLFVGPADLGFDLKARGASVTLDDCLPKVAAAAKAAGKFAGILTRDDADVRKRLSLGYTHQAVDSDLGILRRRWKELTDR